jgi:hypothetical protein
VKGVGEDVEPRHTALEKHLQEVCHRCLHALPAGRLRLSSVCRVDELLDHLVLVVRRDNEQTDLAVPRPHFGVVDDRQNAAWRPNSV